jgi:hypothetical protein
MIELAVQPMHITADTAVIPVIDRIDGMDQHAVDPCAQFVIRAAAAQHLDFHAVPGIGGNFRAAEPLSHRRCYIVARNLVRAQMTLDLAEADFIVGIRRGFEAHDMFMVVACLIAELLAHVDHRAHMHFIRSRWQGAYDLRGVGTALEMDGIGAAEGASIIDQGVFRRADIVIGVIKYPGNKIVPSSRLLIDCARFKAIAKETAPIR